MISKEETKHIAKLARLGLDDEEITKHQKDLSEILDYVDKLKEVNVDGVEPFTHSIDVSNVLRRDAKVERTKDEVNKLQAAFPEKKGGYLKVKAIF